MEKTGSAKSLAERLKAKAQEDREQTEKLFSTELDELGKNLKSASGAVQNSIVANLSGLQSKLTEINSQVLAQATMSAENLRSAHMRIGRLIGLPVLAVCLLTFLGFFGLNWWQWRSLMSLQNQTATARQLLDQLDLVGVSLTKTPEGVPLLLLPRGTDMRTTCGDHLPCVKLEGK